MRAVPQTMTDRWLAQAKTGGARPIVRATIQKANLQTFDYDTTQAPGGDFEEQERHRKGVFTSLVFGVGAGAREIRNIRSYSWTRSLDQDVATCSLTLKNTDLVPIGNATEAAHADDFDLPGYYTYNRGENTVSQNRWGYDTETGWQGFFVPDRVVRTYEGYGGDASVRPAADPDLLPSGVWLVDDVTYTATGDINLEMRDLGRLLLDQIVFPPVIPLAEYPLTWSKVRSELVPGRSPSGGAWERAYGDASSSNELYIGKGLTDPPYDNYVSNNGGVNGHFPAHALVANEGEYWQSTGQTTTRSKVWWQVDLNNPKSIAGLRLRPQGGPYRVYVSVKTANGWVGKRKIPYEVTTEGINLKAGIPFVASAVADKNKTFDIVLPRKYQGVTAVRLTFTRLQDTRVGNYPFRAGLRDVQMYVGAYADLGFKRGYVRKAVGNYYDFTDIVKWACAWGGFFWPPHSTDEDFVQTGPSTDTRQTITYASPDRVLPKGRVWGDFMNAGTAGEADLTIDLFDKQPLMDMINYVRDILGFVFFIDETGGVVWRMPNLWSKGNYLSPGPLAQRTRARTTDFVTIDENETLLDYSTTLSSANLRERVFVANTTGKVGTVIKGFNPYPTGLRRMAGWTDQHFKNNREARVMADMVAARQMFDYRRARVTIPGYPAIQMDDQIRIFEKVTNETYYHYVLGVTSELDMESGVWTYQLETHWLGEEPSDAWAVRVDQLDGATQAYLGLVGQGDS